MSNRVEHVDPQRKRPLVLALRDIAWTRGSAKYVAVSLDIFEGDIILFTGANGSGKSTLLSTLSGTCPISQGLVSRNVRTELVDADLLTESMVRQRLSSEVLARAAQDLDALHLADFRPLDDQSAGERQLQALAVALASPAGLILLESPTTALDTNGRELCVAAIRHLVAQRKTVIATTVDPELLLLLEEAGVVSLSNGSLHNIRKPINQLPPEPHRGDT